MRNIVTDPGTGFSHSTINFQNFILVSCYVFITLLFIIFSNSDCINLIIVVFLFGIQVISAIDTVIIFFLEMVSCYLKF